MRNEKWIQTSKEGIRILGNRKKWLEELVERKRSIPLNVVVKIWQEKYGDKNVTRVKKKIAEIVETSENIKVRWNGKLSLVWNQ